MSEHSATVLWKRQQQKFLDGKYSRAHQWQFDGGFNCLASASPSVVPLPYSNAEHIDPEEAFVASVASCHMLFFLSYAAKAGLIINEYCDHANAILAKNDEDRLAITQIILRPQIELSTDSNPTLELISTLHDKAHKACFIANSIKSEITIEFSHTISA